MFFLHFQVIYELKAGGVDERRLVGAKLEKLAEGETGQLAVSLMLERLMEFDNYLMVCG